MQTFSDTLAQVFRAIAANKLRSFLTMFGIAWGVGSLLVLVGLGEGFRSGQHRNLARLRKRRGVDVERDHPRCRQPAHGDASLPVDAGRRRGSCGSCRRLRGLTVELVALRSLRSEPVEQYFEPRDGRVTRITPQVRFIPMAQGRFLSDADLAERRRVAVLGSKAAMLLFKGRPMVGETMTINGTAVRSCRRGGEDLRAAITTSTTRRSISPSPPCRNCFMLKGEQHCAGCADLDPVPAGKEGRHVGCVRRRASRDCAAPWLRSIA